MKRVTACHGVGRKPEDVKRLHIIELRLLPPVSGVPCFLLPNEGLTPLAMDMSPTNVGYKFRSPTARKLIAKDSNLSVTTNTDNTTIFNCLINNFQRDDYLSSFIVYY